MVTMTTLVHNGKTNESIRKLDENSQQVALEKTRFFHPIKIGNIQLNHRVVLTPLETHKPSLPKDVPNTEWALEYYNQRSQRAGTLVITEAAFPDCVHQNFDLLLGVWNSRQLRAWQEIFQQIHINNSVAFVQLWYMGINSSHPLIHSKNLSYDSRTDTFYVNPGSHGSNSQFGISQAGIKLYVRDFVNACRRLIKVGADGVVIPGTDRFFSLLTLPQSNMREDEYGGSIENRARFILEVVDAVCDAIGHDKVGIQLPPFVRNAYMKPEPLADVQNVYIVAELEKRAQAGKRLAFIQIIEPRAESVRMKNAKPSKEPEVCYNYVYRIWDGPVVRSGDKALHFKKLKDFFQDDRTLLAYDHYFISNPDLVERVEKGWALTRFDLNTFKKELNRGYFNYPTYQKCLELGY